MPLAVLVAASVALAGFAAPAHAGEPERRATFVEVTPKQPVVGTGKPTTVTISASIDAGRPFYEGEILAEVTGPNGEGFDYAYLKDPDGDGVHSAQIRLTAVLSPPGKWTVTTKAISDATGDEVLGPNGAFTVKTKTKLAAKASPKKPRKKAPVTLSGTLRTIKYGSYEGWAKKTVRILFRKKGSTKWTLLTTAKTKGDGRFTKTVRPKAAGSLQIVWKGSPTTTPVKSAIIPVR